MRKIASILVLLSLVVAGVAVAGGAPEDDTLELQWAVVPYQPHFVEIPEQISEMYMEAHPNVRIEVTSIPNDQFFTTIPTLVAAGEVPDVMFNHGGNEEAFAAAGVTLDLTPWMTNGNRDEWPLQIEDFDEGFLGLMTTTDGEIHSLPVAADASVMFFNKDLFDEAGLDYPSADWTYEDLHDYARALTKELPNGTMQYGFVFDPVQSHNAIPGPGAAGFTVSSLNANNEFNFNSPRAVEGWRYFFDGLSEGWSMPVDEIEDLGGYLNAFALGRVAMIHAARWAVPVFRDNLEDDWDVQIMPAGRSGRHFANGGAFGYSVGASTEDPDTAVHFLMSIYSEDAYELWTGNYSVVPTVKSLFESDIWAELPGPPYNNAAFVDTLEWMEPYPQVPWFREETMNQLYREMVDRYAAGDELQTILDDAVELMNRDIAERLAEYQARQE